MHGSSRCQCNTTLRRRFLMVQVTKAKDDPGAPTPAALQNRLAQPVGQPRAAAAPIFGPSVGEPTPGRLSQPAARPASTALPTPQASPFDAIAELQQALAEPGRDPFAVSQPGTQQGVDPFAPSTSVPAAQSPADPFAASTLYGGPGAGTGAAGPGVHCFVRIGLLQKQCGRSVLRLVMMQFNVIRCSDNTFGRTLFHA